jgi:tRNA threonylcarbamoyladenosine biosynthesis protein TsaB
MACLLHIETSTQICSVALSIDGNIIAIRESSEDKSHATLMSSFIDEMLKECQLDISNIDAVSVSKGPGSYTGLRIGVSLAKGICYALEKPLISVSTLEALALGIKNNFEKHIANSDKSAYLFCPMIDARRMEVYTALYNSKNEIIKDVNALIVEPNSFDTYFENHKIIFFGNGAAKCKTSLQHSNAIFIDNIETSAANMISIAERKYQEKNFENTAYFEPYYLKDFVAKMPNVKGLSK